MRNKVYNPALIFAVLLLSFLPATAQIEPSENTKLTLDGVLSTGYSGSFGDNNVSSHGLDFGGVGHLSGSYYDPKFFAFDFQPYYRRSQSNSAFQSITDTSGFTSSANIFGGSRFPGSLSYSRTYDSAGQFGVPGVEGITTSGNGSNIGITWSALLPDLPTLTASYSSTAGSSTVFGTNDESESSARNFTLQSTYTLSGFRLQGEYTRLVMDGVFPDLLGNGQAQNSSTASNTFLFNAGHELPLSGYWSFGWNRSSYDGQYQIGSSEGSSNGTINDVNTMFSLNPTRKLSVSFGGDFNDNVYGALRQQLLDSGGLTSFPTISSSARTYSVTGQAGYSVFSHLALYARATHHELELPEGNRGLTQFSGNAAFNYAHRWLGALTFALGVIDTATEDGNSGASVVGNASYLRRINGWEVEGDFGYTQQIQTLVSVYNTSMYTYGSRVKRRFGTLLWAASFTGSHSGLAQYDGFSSSHESFATSIHYGRFSVNGQYSQSDGTSVLTPGGLVELPPGLPPSLVEQPILYNGKSYGGGASFRPFRRAIVTGSYNKATSDTVGPLRATSFDSNIVNARFQYRLRKLDFDANYTRFNQNVTAGTLPAVINSYWFRVSRWFNVF